MVVKTINFVERSGDDVRSYHIPIVKEVDCLSEKTTYKYGRQIDRGILIKENIPDFSIFKIAGEIDKCRTVVRVDLAESLLKKKTNRSVT